MLVRLVIEIWDIGLGGPKRGGRKCGGLVRKAMWGCWILWPLCVFGCISVVEV
jgi:hypothetical protein